MLAEPVHRSQRDPPAEEEEEEHALDLLTRSCGSTKNDLSAQLRGRVGRGGSQEPDSSAGAPLTEAAAPGPARRAREAGVCHN